VQTAKSNLEKDYEKLTEAADQQGEIWHREISAVVDQRKSEIEEKKNKHLAVLEQHTGGVTQRMTEIKQAIVELKNCLDTNDISVISNYAFKNDFNKYPPTINVTLPILSTPEIDTEKVNAMFGSLSSLTVTKVISTGHEKLISVRCHTEDKVWTCGLNKIIQLHNFQGQLLESIQTKSWYVPLDIALTRDGDFIYTDPTNKTVNLVKNKQIHTLITLKRWKPRFVCSTSSDDLLVTMINDDATQCKVVRYTGSSKKQTIQYDDEGRPLYSCVYKTKFISENRNSDICVADYAASAVVVVSQAGKLRFRYTGDPSDRFYPYGIATDSQSHILAADGWNYSIHVLDQDGQFLRYVRGFDRPWGMCVDIKDNIFVAEFDTARVNQIQYL
jgi:hypothetical protein